MNKSFEMGKRHTNWPEGPDLHRKRLKIAHEPPTSEEVSSCRQLQKLLAFSQDLRLARHGLQSFKLLLDKLGSGEGPQPEQMRLLHDYLAVVRPETTGADDAVFLPDVMETWSLAVEVHNEGVMSSVVVILSLLLGVLSNSLDDVDYGLGICSTLLQERQQKLIAKNLSAEKNKGFIISPTLRLLRETVQFDGGVVAKRIYRARAFLFTSLDRNLEVKHIGDGPEDASKSSVRTNAIRFLLACVKYLPSDARKELIQEKHIISHLTYMLQTDPPHVIREICHVLRQYVMEDEKIPREVKFRVFNTKTLLRFLSLYNYSHETPGSDESASLSVPEAVHQFLIFACTESVAGVLSPCTGFYPKGAILSDVNTSTQGDPMWFDQNAQKQYAEEVPVYNFALAEFVQKLRPWSSMKHSELLVRIFRAAPELVSNYMVNNRSFAFEPKLTMTWMGYAAFLFSTSQLPLPDFFGAKSQFADLPPPTSILLDNILPYPISRKVITRCFAPETPLPAFIAARLLILAMEKLKTALDMHSQPQKQIWSKAGERLLATFAERLPDPKDIMRSYKSIPPENILHRVAASRLLLLCCEIVPAVIVAANLDLSSFVQVSLSRLQGEPLGEDEDDGGNREDRDDRALFHSELKTLISIANYCPKMRWFSKGKDVSLSPFSAVLKLWIEGDVNVSVPSLKSVLESVAIEYYLVLSSSGLGPLYQTFRSLDQELVQTPNALWAFLDNCACRCAGSALKYLEIMDNTTQQLPAGSISPGAKEKVAVSFWLWTMAEQVPYAVKTCSYDELSVLTAFIRNYLSYSSAAKETTVLLEVLRKQIATTLPSDLSQLLLSGKLEPPPSEGDQGENSKSRQTSAVPEPEQAAESQQEHDLDDEELKELLHVLPLSASDSSALTRWTLKPVDELVEEGYTASLIKLLLSEDVGIRKEALTNILKMADRIRQSLHKEREQIWLLLSELAESAREHVDERPAPTCFAAFASHALDVLKSPLHPLYPKVNSFLARQPTWSGRKLPLTHEIFYYEPAIEGKYYAELSWLLTYLVDCLGTPSDLDIFHHRRIFEELFLLYCNPFLKMTMKLKVLKIVYRATCIDGGSNTLATRFGAFSWLEVRGRCAKDKTEKAACEALFLRLWATCDQEKISKWSREGIPLLVESGVWRRR